MRRPSIYKAKRLQHLQENMRRVSDGTWIPARPECITTVLGKAFLHDLLWRIKATIGVFTGRYDAIDWEDKK